MYEALGDVAFSNAPKCAPKFACCAVHNTTPLPERDQTNRQSGCELPLIGGRDREGPANRRGMRADWGVSISLRFPPGNQHTLGVSAPLTINLVLLTALTVNQTQKISCTLMTAARITPGRGRDREGPATVGYRSPIFGAATPCQHLRHGICVQRNAATFSGAKV